MYILAYLKNTVYMFPTYECNAHTIYTSKPPASAVHRKLQVSCTFFSNCVFEYLVLVQISNIPLNNDTFFSKTA